MKSISPEMVALYDSLQKHTFSYCVKYCDMHNCCSADYCEEAERFSAEHGVTLERTGHPTLPFMSSTGCVVPAHLRPRCTEFSCGVHSMIKKPSDPKWKQEYYALRKKIYWLQKSENNDAR